MIPDRSIAGARRRGTEHALAEHCEGTPRRRLKTPVVEVIRGSCRRFADRERCSGGGVGSRSRDNFFFFFIYLKKDIGSRVGSGRSKAPGKWGQAALPAEPTNNGETSARAVSVRAPSRTTTCNAAGKNRISEIDAMKHRRLPTIKTQVTPGEEEDVSHGCRFPAYRILDAGCWMLDVRRCQQNRRAENFRRLIRDS